MSTCKRLDSSYVGRCVGACRIAYRTDVVVSIGMLVLTITVMSKMNRTIKTPSILTSIISTVVSILLLFVLWISERYCTGRRVFDFLRFLAVVLTAVRFSLIVQRMLNIGSDGVAWPPRI